MLRVKIKAGALLTSLLVISYIVPKSSAAGLCDPNPCGKGAECQDRNNLLVCSCPEGWKGDPFESCRPGSASESTSETTTSTSTTSSSSSTRSSSPSTQHYSSQASSSSSTPHNNNNNNYDRIKDSTEVTQYSSSSTSNYNRHNPNQPVLIDTTSYRRTSNSPMSTTYSQNDKNDEGHGHGVTYIRTSTSTNPFGSGHGVTTETHSYRTNTNSDDRHSDRDRDHGNNRNTNTYGNNDRRGNNDNNRDRDNSHHRNSHNNNESDKNKLFAYQDNNNKGSMDGTGIGRTDYVANSRETYYDGNGNRRVFEDSNSRVRYSSGNQNSNFHDRGFSSSSVGTSYANDKDYNSPNRVKDPLGVYSNCKKINGAIVCADNSDSGSGNGGGDFRGKPFERESNRQDYDDNYSYRHRPAPVRNHNNGNGFQEFVVRSQEPYSSNNNYNRDRDDFRNGKPNQSQNQDNHQNQTPQPGDPEQCKKYCGQDAVCRFLLGRPICGCKDGYEGDASVRCYPSEAQIRMKNRCHKHTDCLNKEVCENSQCTDPCKDSYAGSSNFHFRSKRYNHFSESGRIRNSNKDSHGNIYGGQNERVNDSPGVSSGNSVGGTCGRNTRCQVIDHTLLCVCLQGYVGNPFRGCT